MDPVPLRIRLIMKPISIFVSEEDIDSAWQIARKMFPETDEAVEERHVLGTAARLGIEQLKLIYKVEATVKP